MYLPHNAGVGGLRANTLSMAMVMGRNVVTEGTSVYVNADGDASPSGGWSSLIGIITAIIGNVLISFALNTQRYAHLRLARERERQEDEEDKKDAANYLSDQSEIAEDRAHKNLDVLNGANEERAGREASETDPLLPSTHSRTSSMSHDSESTVRPSKKSPSASSSSSSSASTKSYLQSPIWWLGISLMTVGEAGNFLAYGFAPASIVSPLGVVALVVNCLIAPWMLHERFRIRDGLGVIIAIGGCVIIVFSASDSNPKLAPDKIWDLITTWEFETYLGITIFLIIVLMVGSNTEFGEKSILVDLGLVGLFGGYTALSTKGVASLLSNTLWRAITFPITYLLVAILVGTAIMQIKYINRALQRFDSTQVIPTQFVLFTISVILGSAVLYRDFERQTTQDAIKFVAGCALTFFGVWLITSGRKTEKDDDEGEEDSQNGDAINLVDETGQQSDIRAREDGKPRMQVVRSDTPSVVITSNDAESYHGSFVGPSSFVDPAFAGGVPTNISAIHIKSAEQLPASSGEDGRPQQPPRMHATTSAPVLPTAATLSSNTIERPSTPARQRTSPAPETPVRAAGSYAPRSPSQRPPQHQDSSEAQQPHNTPGRRSIADILPGPLVAPLSSSLSAIVADSLRRGVDIHTRPRTMERRRTTRRSVRPQRSFAAGDNLALLHPGAYGGGPSGSSSSGARRYDGGGSDGANDDGFLPLRMTTSEIPSASSAAHDRQAAANGQAQHAQPTRESMRGRERSFSDYFRYSARRRSRADTLESERSEH